MFIKVNVYKNKNISYSQFLEEYQKMTMNFVKEMKVQNQSKEDLIVDKLMSMSTCLHNPEYTKELMQRDLNELLSFHSIEKMNVKVNDPFDPEKHDPLQFMNDSYKNYVIEEVIEDGYMKENQVKRKAIVKAVKL